MSLRSPRKGSKGKNPKAEGIIGYTLENSEWKFAWSHY